MPKSSIPSPARSLGSITPRRHRTRLSRSVGSPARNASKMTAVEKLKAGNRDSFVPSPLSKTVLNDNTDIEEPRRESWWKNVDKSRDVMEVLDERPVGTNNIVDEFDVEILSQEKRDYSMDIPESSGSESIPSIIVPQRKLFTHKEYKPEDKYKQIIETRESMAMAKHKEHEDKPVEAGRKTLFGHSKHSKPVFPSALLNISPDKTLIGNKTKELAADICPPRSLFGNRAGTKRKNIFADYILSESEDEIPDIQARRFTFTKQPEPLPRKSSASRRDTSPASSITTDIELDDWKHLPSSTMMEHQLEDATTPARRARLSKLIETRETINTNSTANKTRQSEKSRFSKDKSVASEKENNEIDETGGQIEKVFSPPKNFNSSKNKSLTKTKNASQIEKELEKPIKVDVDANNVNISRMMTRNASRVELFEDPATNKVEININDVDINTNEVEANKIDNLTKTLNKTDADVHRIDNLTRTLNKTDKQLSKSNIDENMVVHGNKIDNLTRTLNKTGKNDVDGNKIDNLTLTLNKTGKNDVDGNKIDNLTRTLNKTGKNLSNSKIDESKTTVETEKVDNLTRTLNKSNKLSKSNISTNKQDALETELASIVGQEEEEQNDEHIHLTYEDDEPEIHQDQSDEPGVKHISANTNKSAQNNISAANISSNKTQDVNNTAQNKTAQMKEKTLVTETPMPRKSKSVMSRVINETVDTINEEQLDNLDIIPEDVDEEAIFKPSQELRRSTEKPNKSQENKQDSMVEGKQLIAETSSHKNLHESKVTAKNTDERVENEELAEVDSQDQNELEKELEISRNEENDVIEVDEEEQVVNESEPLIDEDEDEQQVDDSQEESEQEDIDESQEMMEEIDSSQEIDVDEQNESQDLENEEQNESQKIENDEQDLSQEIDEENQDESLEIDNEEHNEIELNDGLDESNEIENDEQDVSQEIENNEQDESHEIDEVERDASKIEEEQDESHEVENDEQEVSLEIEEEQDESRDIAEEEQDENDEQDVSQEIDEENQVENTEQVDSDIPDTPNASHDTTGRHRQKDKYKPQSPEAILHASNTPMESFIGSKGRNTSIRKTILKKNFSVRQSIAPPPPRDSTDGSKNSTVEGSGWDSHRNERKTLRLTFGKDFTPRKSLRTMVMEKSAKRQTIIDDANMKLHQANSTELPMEYEESAVHEDAMETHNDISLQARRTKLDDYWKQFKKDTIHEMAKIEDEIRQSLKRNVTKGDFMNSKIPSKLVIRQQPLKLQTAPKSAKRTLASLENLPPELIEDMKYKPPKRFRPSNAPWITKRLYNFLENKLKPKYDYKARVRAEKLVETIYAFSRDLRRLKTATPASVTDLKREMARLDVVKTHYEFYHFFNEFLPNEVRFKVVPDIVNKIPTPRDGVFSDILESDAIY